QCGAASGPQAGLRRARWQATRLRPVWFLRRTGVRVRRVYPNLRRLRNLNVTGYPVGRSSGQAFATDACVFVGVDLAYGPAYDLHQENVGKERFADGERRSGPGYGGRPDAGPL